jgi:hypothetical protein
MKKVILVCFISLSTFIASAQKVTSLRIDPDNSRGGKTSDFFESVNFIPLETTKESTFGRIYYLEVTEKYFIIFDTETNATLIFYRSGKFHAKINRRTSNEYFGRFTLNREAKEIILKASDKALVYDYDGKFIREEKILDKTAMMFYLNKKAILYHQNRGLEFSATDETKYDLVYSEDAKEPAKKFLPYNSRYAKNDYNLPYYLFSQQSDGSCVFTMPYSYLLSQFDDKGLVQQFKINLPIKYSLPSNFDLDSTYTGKRKEFIFRDNGLNASKIKEIAPTFLERNYLLFHSRNISGYFTYTTDLLYSLETKTLYGLNRISGDDLSLGFPILDSHFGGSMVAVNDGNLYTSIQANILFSFKEKSKSDSGSDKLSNSQLSKVSKSDNPIIIESKIKSGL